MSKIDGKELLLLGGTGSLGKTITRLLATKYKPKGLRIYSRGELLQWEIKQKISNWKNINTNISFLIGDVRDRNRLSRAMNNVDYVFNMAAMKQVPACEENPIEAIKTNIDGARNILDTAINNNVKKVMHVSTDKACMPINLYGATKAVAEKLFIHGNTYSPHGTMFSCCRYGNVLGSRGSIIPLFKKQIEDTGKITITDKRMTRFWIFIPKMPSMKVLDMASILAFNHCYRTGKEIEIKEIGIRKGEKLDEILIGKEEAACVTDRESYYVIEPLKEVHNFDYGWTYSSDNNEDWLSKSRLEEIIE
jgi:FlaA1/EpsC-like NDP-sugar epimerase